MQNGAAGSAGTILQGARYRWHLWRAAWLALLLMLAAGQGTARAQAACQTGACVNAGPRLASVTSQQGPLLNLLLRALLPGSTVNLSVTDWNALAGSDVNLNLLLLQLRNQLGVSSTQQLQMNGSTVHSWGAHTLNVGARFARATRVPVGAIDGFSLGGFQQLSGYRVGQVAGNYLLLGRLTYYQRLPWNVGVARALFAGGSLEGGNAWASRRDISIHGLRWGTSLFIGADTGMGPLYLSVVSAPKGYTGLYVFLGRP